MTPIWNWTQKQRTGSEEQADKKTGGIRQKASWFTGAEAKEADQGGRECVHYRGIKRVGNRCVSGWWLWGESQVCRVVLTDWDCDLFAFRVSRCLVYVCCRPTEPASVVKILYSSPLIHTLKPIFRQIPPWETISLQCRREEECLERIHVPKSRSDWTPRPVWSAPLLWIKAVKNGNSVQRRRNFIS